MAENVGRKFEKKFSEQEKCIKDLYLEVSLLKKQLESQEQFLRSLNLRIFGIPVDKEEDLCGKIMHLFTEIMKIDKNAIKETDIKSCFRVSAKTPRADKQRPSAVLVHFFNNKVRALVLKNKKSLKATGIQIQEDLTQFRLKLYQDAINKFSKKKVWTHNCIVYVKFNDTVHRIENQDDLIF